MRSTVLFRVLLVVVVVIATRPCLANVKNDFHETNGGNICNYTAQVSRGGLGGGGVGVSEKNSSGMLLGERKFSGGNGGKGGGGGSGNVKCWVWGCEKKLEKRSEIRSSNSKG